MSDRGKEVLKGKLFYRRKGSSLKKRVVTAYCGGASSANGKIALAQLTLNEDYEKVEKPGQKPKNMILLEGVKIDCSYISSSTVYSNPARMSASPSPSPHGSSQGGSGSGIISAGSGSGSGSGTITSGNLYTFSIIAQNGDTHEFLCESENDRLRWVKLLQLLIMFPHSTIPAEPTNIPFNESMRANLEAKTYNADSIWPVYILPEEVGMRCHIIGINVIALRSGVEGHSIGRLEIYNAADPTTPLISWERDKMRRTGKTGNLVFIEIGRRCQGGPGLVWMFTGFNDAQALRETLHNFLFKGDGRAVAIPAQHAPIYDVPRSSFDTSLPPSYKRHNSIPNGNNHMLVRSRSHDHDSGYPPSPIGSMNTPPQLEGPPVRLDKHPSIRRKSGGTHPREISRSNSTTSFGSLSDRDMSYPPTARSGDLVEPPNGGDGSGDSSRSNSPPDDDCDVIGQMDPDQPTNGHYDSVPRHVSPDGGIAMMQQRLVLGGVDETPSHYEEMTHPRNSMHDFDGYVSMKPAEKVTRATSAPIPVGKRNSVPQADDMYHHLQRRPSPQNSSSPRGRNNYDQLPTISERSNYENHPLPHNLKGVSIEYRPNYQNVELAERGRRGSQNQVYDQVDSSGERSQNSNGNNSNGGQQKRKFSFRRRSSDKESVKLSAEKKSSPSTNRKELPTQNGGFSDIEGYVVIQSKSESGHVVNSGPGMLPVGYASIDYQSTEVIGTMREQRQLQGQDHRSQVVLSDN